MDTDGHGLKKHPRNPRNPRSKKCLRQRPELTEKKEDRVYHRCLLRLLFKTPESGRSCRMTHWNQISWLPKACSNVVVWCASTVLLKRRKPAPHELILNKWHKKDHCGTSRVAKDYERTIHGLPQPQMFGWRIRNDNWERDQEYFVSSQKKVHEALRAFIVRGHPAGLGRSHLHVRS